MNRYKLTIEYNGSNFVGWQRQQNGVSVQQVLEEAIFKFSGKNTKVYAAGRTDAGVHALGQVVHCDLDVNCNIQDAINYYLKPYLVSVIRVEKVGKNFHSRFSAKKKTYLYRIINRKANLVLNKGRAWHILQELNVDMMRLGVKYLIGERDFTTFMSMKSKLVSPVRTLDSIDIVKKKEKILIYVRAQSFLHHQVRNIVGTLKLVGEGKWKPDDIKIALEARDRRKAGVTAPAGGLFLMKVYYDD